MIQIFCRRFILELQKRLFLFMQEIHDRRSRLRRLENYAVRIVDNELHQVFVCGIVQIIEIFFRHALALYLGFELFVQLSFERIVVKRNDDLHFFEYRIVCEQIAQVNRHDRREPSVAVHHVRRPAQFFDRLQHPPGKKDGPLVVVREQNAVLVADDRLAVKIIFVVDKIEVTAVVSI